MRSKKYKKIILGFLGVLVLFIISAYFVGLQSKNHSVKLQESSENPAIQNSEENDLTKKTSSDQENLQLKENTQLQENIKQNENVAENQNLIEASLKVQDKNYATKIKEGSSAYDLMNQLKIQGFNFSATEYSNLGFFVTEINGVKEDRKNSTYWTLYINGQESTVGASQLILKEGDLIEWKNENRKNY